MVGANGRSYKIGDIVLVKSRAGPGIPHTHVRLLKKHTIAPSEGRTMSWPGFVGYDAELVYEEEADKLRKEWSIPFKFPDDIKTFVFEDDIIKKVRKRRKRKPPRNRKTS